MKEYKLMKQFLITDKDLEKIFSNQKVNLMYKEFLRQLYEQNFIQNLFRSGVEGYNKSIVSLREPFPYSQKDSQQKIENILKLQIIGDAFEITLKSDTNIIGAVQKVMNGNKEEIWKRTYKNYIDYIKELSNPNKFFTQLQKQLY